MRRIPLVLMGAVLSVGCTTLLGITDVHDAVDAGEQVDASEQDALAAGPVADAHGAPGSLSDARGATEAAACLPGADCTLRTSCQRMAIDCSTRSALCKATGSNVTDGTSCGTNMVCGAGSCVACESGADCTPAMSCKKMAIDCTTGAALCKATGGDITDGTSCGTNLYCNAGSCASCTNGSACTPTGKACNQGIVSCTEGQLVCADQGTLMSDGTACGTNLVCFGGQCQPCSANAPCSPSNPCHVGLTSCTSGMPVCVDTGNLQSDGTACAGGADKCQQTYTCQMGTCTGSNPVVCPEPAACHTVGACDMTTGACSNPTATDGTECTGTNTCLTYTCNAGACTGRLVGAMTCSCCTNTDSCGRCIQCRPSCNL